MNSTSTAAMTPSLDRLRRLVSAHAPTDGVHETPLDGVQIFRVSSPVDRVPGVYEPSVCVVVQGSKRAYHDGRTHRYDPGRYFCTTVPTPLEAEIVQASPEAPVLGLLIGLDTRSMTELMIQHRAANPRAHRNGIVAGGPVVADWDDAFTTALLRLLELLDDRAALELLAPGRLRELLYSIVVGPAGELIEDTLGSSPHRLAPVLSYMRANLDQPLAVEDLAARAGLSRAAFDRHFKAVTALSPLKYLKALRLNDAAMLVANGLAISEAAHRVGYASPSQFSREFKRHFGVTPREWAASVRSADPQALAAT